MSACAPAEAVNNFFNHCNYYMAFYNKEKRSEYGGPKKFGNGGGFDRNDRGDRGGRGGFGGRTEMFQAVCSQCQKDCEVPFRPNGRKPVFCSICFGKQGGTSPDKGGERSFGRPERSFDRPSFGGRGSRDFAPSRPAPQENLKEQFDKLSNKLDRIIDLLMKTEAPTPSKMEMELENEEDKMPPIVKKVKKVAKAKRK
ncbi:MAG: hypothetical protein A2821_03935 [Candidatus Magasanikbacteria bacterium RIFCSPHIGHO2_01_FULL_41_23]|uniref:CxxC-x17-CxxC domain-containing protein n=1 Tax=Candidatus Magasanikbacteria bacterium RIFCSPLOWO2_01_FULL_40_15 TaxID=1798686 RepID=A0A1F6N2V0_9BACT|nr:MAG: hypothetical protein A2821_03935 [Candidatus Magasanikbacteria bacterium RIFCSPHIGHO2_01_FULL_41_23]OGH74947.1 MAG: hypothetical protein A3F22_02610 [Candidatus Magasanikbacteria bacterium RIFCSPHIGHO2_12_FULL_41_16]OGH78249.1 MAG: hypothetical protein A2983_02245 [Candidatus Magasanikbacteria bacterium RIFCSPLOWO2_01_FULL_40_15]